MNLVNAFVTLEIGKIMLLILLLNHSMRIPQVIKVYNLEKVFSFCQRCFRNRVNQMYPWFGSIISAGFEKHHCD